MTMVQHGIVGSMTTPADLSYLADALLLLRYFETGGEVRQAISVLKKRTGQHERKIREMRIGEGGIHVGPPLSDFQGILTGVPKYVGLDAPLMRKAKEDAHA
jgi:circadian clock protein KaiC